MEDYNKRANLKYSQFLSEKLSIQVYGELLGNYFPEFTYRDFINDILTSNSVDNIIFSLEQEIKISPSMRYRKKSSYIINFYRNEYKQPIESGSNLEYYKIDKNLWLNERFSPGAVLSCINFIKYRSLDKDFLEFHNISGRNQKTTGGCLSIVIFIVISSSILSFLIL